MFGVGLTLPKLSAVLLNAIGGLLAAYKINDLTPDLVADFNGSLNTGTEFYDAGGTVDTFAELITHSRAGNATMIDGYGPELVTNGTFVSDDLTGWGTANTNISVVDGELEQDYLGTGGGGSYYDFSTTAGKTYLFKWSYRAGTTTAVVYINSGDFTNSLGQAAANAGFAYFTADDATSRIYFRSGVAGTIYLDNVSVREIPVIKWAPHNLVTYSEDFSHLSWNTVTSNFVDYVLVPTATTATHYVTKASGSTNTSTRLEFLATPEGYNFIQVAANNTASNFATFDLSNGTVSVSGGATTASIEPLGDGYVCSVNIATGYAVFYLAVSDQDYGTRLPSFLADGTSGVRIQYPRTYRSDLGGMVDNSDRGDSYVPTTSSARYLPRRNHHVYNGDAWVNEGLLVESESRTNLLTYSEDFSNAYWPKADVTVSASSEIDPSGGTNAYELIESATTANHLLNKAGVAGANTYSEFIFAKANTRYWIRLQSQSPSNSWVNVNLLTGEKGLSGGGEDSSSVENVGNGWYKISLNFTATTTTGPQIFVLDSDRSGSSPSYLGDGSSSILIYGAQFEAGSTPSSYIPTSGSSVSRAAETLTIPAANMPWPEPNYIGSELVTNGAFDDATGWTLGAGWAISSGTLNWSGGYNRAAFPVGTGAFEAGKVYKIFGTVSNYTSGRVNAYIALSGNPLSASAPVPQANGDFTLFLAPAATVNEFGFIGNDASGARSIDNISVREIDPLSVSIQMQGRMTYADTGGLDASFVRWYADSANNIRLENWTSSARTGQIVFKQLAANVLDQAISSMTAYSPGINVPYNIASRHGSTFINGATDGTALTADTTPTALPDLSSTDLNLAYDYMGTISMFRVWADDLADVGIAEATEPSEVPSLQLTFDNSETSFTIQDWEQ